MSDVVTITEHIRFNDDGSSDHIKVIGDKLFSSEHFDKSPYALLDKDIAWAIWTTYQEPSK